MQILSYIESINEWIGKCTMWFVYLLAAIISYDVILRYVFSLPTLWVFDTSYTTFSFLFLLGLGYTQVKKGHVNVDLLISKYSPKGQALWRVIFYLFVILPFVAVILYYSLFFAIQSWKLWEESSMSTIGFPVYPLKTMLPIGFFFLLLQCFADFFRDLIIVVKGGKS